MSFTISGKNVVLFGCETKVKLYPFTTRSLKCVGFKYLVVGLFLRIL